MNSVLRLLSAGAAQGITTALAPGFHADTECVLEAGYAPVGVVEERLLAGEPCDVVVSTLAMLEEFARNGRIDGATIALLGRVHTGVAVRSGDPVPAIDSRERLHSALSAATRIHVPDPERATAGIHFVKVSRALGIYDVIRPRLASHANGAAAMAALAAATVSAEIGCTQVTEIVFAPGVRLVGALPAPFDLATPYAAAASTSARDRELARRFISMLTGSRAAALRRESGFEV
jgi:molybdate transport system substrate-binding protein